MYGQIFCDGPLFSMEISNSILKIPFLIYSKNNNNTSSNENSYPFCFDIDFFVDFLPLILRFSECKAVVAKMQSRIIVFYIQTDFTTCMQLLFYFIPFYISWPGYSNIRTRCIFLFTIYIIIRGFETLLTKKSYHIGLVLTYIFCKITLC